MQVSINIDRTFGLQTKRLAIRYRPVRKAPLEQVFHTIPDGSGHRIGKVVLDTGCDGSLFPKFVSELLGVNFNTCRYYKGCGIGSVVVIHYTGARTFIGVEGTREDGRPVIAWGQVAPATYICSVPGIAAGINKLDDDDAFDIGALGYFKPPVHNTKDDKELKRHNLDYNYSWIVESPRRAPRWNEGKRCILETHGGDKPLLTMLLGSDWIRSMKKVEITQDQVIIEPNPEIKTAMNDMWRLRKILD